MSLTCRDQVAQAVRLLGVLVGQSSSHKGRSMPLKCLDCHRQVGRVCGAFSLSYVARTDRHPTVTPTLLFLAG
eukprot:1045961-Amphidinium_carterae.1